MNELPHAATASNREIVALLPELRAFARRFEREASDVESLVEETISAAVVCDNRSSTRMSLKSWLFTIMRDRYHARNGMRSAKDQTVAIP
jgi:RNA polymerase sigma-70 factor (ECF subfamily)